MRTLLDFNGIALISDAMPPAASEPESYELHSHRHVGRALRADDGVLAGAVNSMRDAVAFVAVDLGLPLADALRKAISPPARFGLDHQIGRFVPGARANLVHLTGSLAVARAWVGGCDARELAGAQ